jgi:hypothetical protein
MRHHSEHGRGHTVECVEDEMSLRTSAVHVSAGASTPNKQSAPLEGEQRSQVTTGVWRRWSVMQ